jgi:hypothetical protein
MTSKCLVRLDVPIGLLSLLSACAVSPVVQMKSDAGGAVAAK